MLKHLRGASVRAEDLARFLEKLASEIRANDSEIVEILERVENRVDGRWLINPSETAAREIKSAASRLGIPESHVAALLKVKTYVRREKRD